MYDGFPERSLGGGTGGQWNATLAAVPHFDGSLTSFSLSFSLSPFLGVVLVLTIEQDILEDETTNLQEQPRRAKWCCAMTFLVDERVIAHYYAWYPLANQESHCTASFRASWLFLQICVFHLLKCLGLKHQRGQGWWGWVRGRQQGELCVRRHFRWCHRPMWHSVKVVSKFKCRLIIT